MSTTIDIIINDNDYTQDINNYLNSLIIYNSFIIFKFIQQDKSNSFSDFKDRLTTNKNEFIIFIKEQINNHLSSKTKIEKITEITDFLKKNKSEFTQLIIDILNKS